MNKICYRALNRFQIYTFNGDVRLCGWMRDMYLGNLIDNTVEELFNNESAIRIRNRLLDQDYSMCMEDSCPYIANNTVGDILVDYDSEQRFPTQLALGFEQTCNYACTGCTFHSKPHGVDAEQLEKNYSIIEERVREALPYVKSITANGCGELFASKHILQLLSEWNPSKDCKDVSASLETNGSLFDESHWRKIENLGNYPLSVSISIMSFNEDIYRYLSGTKLPITQIENNLRFVKSLRENGVINSLELCTVVQEQNFREMPEFTRRCIEEFGADSVRLRPYAAWGAERPDVAWFKNPRNPRHPLYSEYKKVMSSEIFKHPAVDDWSGGQDAEDVSFSPYDIAKKELAIMEHFWLNSDALIRKIYELTPGCNGKVAVYGVSDIAKSLVRKLDSEDRIRLEYMIDRDCVDWYFEGKRIWRHIHLDSQDKNLLVIVAILEKNEEVVSFLKSKGFMSVITLKSLVEDEKI